MARKKRQIFGLICVTGVILVVGFVALRILGLSSAGSELDLELLQARREGIATEPEDFARPPVPDGENAANGLMALYERARKLPGDPVGVLTDYTGIAISPTAEKRAIEALEPLLGDAETLSRLPHYDPHRDLRRGWDVDYRDREAIRNLQRCLAIRVRLDIDANRQERTFAGLTAMANLARMMGEEPDVSALFLRLSIEYFVIKLAQEALDKFPVSESGIESARKIFSSLGPISNLRRAQACELVVERILLKQYPAWSMRHPNANSGGMSVFDSLLLRVKSVRELNESNLIKDIRTVYRLLPRNPSQVNRSVTALRKVPGDGDSSTILDAPEEIDFSLGRLFPVFRFKSAAVDAWARDIARRRVFAAGIDIMEHARKTGNFPTIWGKNGPDGIDPFSDKPLIYRRIGPGFIVYSIDADRVDNGGRIKPNKDDSKRKKDIAFAFDRAIGK
ncbi:MAG: hypothetical protein P4L46_22475 [Fimbriimonas sp.]|nr:hypothetical protein [Fimbriimonas sp.]